MDKASISWCRISPPSIVWPASNGGGARPHSWAMDLEMWVSDKLPQTWVKCGEYSDWIRWNAMELVN